MEPELRAGTASPFSPGLAALPSFSNHVTRPVTSPSDPRLLSSQFSRILTVTVTGPRIVLLKRLLLW
jgi:hypothetical protein